MEPVQSYGFATTEKQWQQFWETEGIYRFDRHSSKPVYSIDTPPPTISGNIHIGHIFSYTQAEIIARYKRMRGYNVFYPFGFDDNGLPTERLVEKEIGKRGGDMDRKEFVSICLEVTKKYRGIFRDLWKSVGISADWDLEYSTISPLAQRISQRSFLELLQDGRIKRLDTPALWCTECRTSIAQAELEDRMFDSIFYEIPFVLEDGAVIRIATTRPELLSACVAVFVHPDDARYRGMIGESITTPLGDTVRILADEKVLIEKGTGAVMCCTYGDETDMYWQKTYGLEEKIIMSSDGTIQNTSIDAINGQYYKKARKILVEMLREQDKILKETPIEHGVQTHERCGTPIEILPMSQWFTEILPIKQQLLANADRIEWYPAYMKKRYIDWVENLKWDWCISRQRFYGVPTPVWHSKLTGELILPDLSDLPIDPVTDRPKWLPAGHTMDDIEPDYNVFDTWATSSLTTEINARAGEPDSLEDVILPMDLRPQAHDIIRTWTFYAIAKSQLHRDDIPFRNIMISGHVLAKGREKISKSKNNAGKSPEELIEQYSADVVRYWACGAVLGKDAILDEQEILKGRKIVNKLWNVLWLLRITLASYDRTILSSVQETLAPTDLFILSRIQRTSEQMKDSLDDYDIRGALTVFEDLFWNDFCDNYLEIIKDRMYFPEKYANSEAQRLSAAHALFMGFFAILKLIAPILPHITEAIYQDFFRGNWDEKSIHLASYDVASPSISDEIRDGGVLFFGIISSIRKAKTERGIRLGEEISRIELSGSTSEMDLLRPFADDIRSLCKAREIVFTISDRGTIEISLDR